MPRYEMPHIPLDTLSETLTPEDYQVVKRIVNTRTGALRASKPPIEYELIEGRYGKTRSPQEPSGASAYVWRMVAFACSTKPQHHCMPVMAFCDVPGYSHDNCKAREEELNVLADRVIDSVPVTKWHGIARWARTGLIG